MWQTILKMALRLELKKDWVELKDRAFLEFSSLKMCWSSRKNPNKNPQTWAWFIILYWYAESLPPCAIVPIKSAFLMASTGMQSNV